MTLKHNFPDGAGGGKPPDGGRTFLFLYLLCFLQPDFQACNDNHSFFCFFKSQNLKQSS